MTRAAVRCAAMRNHSDCTFPPTELDVPHRESSTGSPVDSQDWKKNISIADSLKRAASIPCHGGGAKRVTGDVYRLAGAISKLDDEIKALQTAIRREAGSDELDKMRRAERHDKRWIAPRPLRRPLPPTNNQQIARRYAGDERVRAVSRRCCELRRDPDLLIQVDELDAILSHR